MIYTIIKTKEADIDIVRLAKENKNHLIKLQKLLISMSETPFSGIGKPEPLKHHLSGYWSRRIDEKHRVV